jgi:hypothetical protein
MGNKMDVWYEENDRVLSPVRGPPQTSRSNKCISVLRSIYRTLARCSLKTYLLAAITQHHAEEQLGRVWLLRRYHGTKKGLPGVRSVFARFRRVMNEVSLRRDRQIRMGVEHEPEQRSPRTPCPDDAGRWG